MQRACLTTLTVIYNGWTTTYRTFVWYVQIAYLGINSHHFRYYLVSLDDCDTCSCSSYSQTFTFTDIAKRCPSNYRSFQFNGFKYCNRRNLGCCTRPFHSIQCCLSLLILPFEGESSTCGMVSCHRTRCCKHRIVVSYYESINRKRILSICYFLRPFVDDSIHCVNIGSIYSLPLHRCHAHMSKAIHPVTPFCLVAICIYERERNPSYMSFSHF